MAKQYKYEIYEHEAILESFLNDPACVGMKPIAIYSRPDREGNWDVIVWWEIEDAEAKA
jgi:hypothetical protein